MGCAGAVVCGGEHPQVVAVEPDSAAARAGLAAGDEILTIAAKSHEMSSAGRS